MAAQDVVEALFVRLWTEFPDLTAEQVTALVRDELLNARQLSPALHAWVSVETAERLRRTALLGELRRTQRDYARLRDAMCESSPPPKRKAARRRCPKCKLATPIASRCSRCGATVP